MERLFFPTGTLLPKTRLEAFSDGVFAIVITLLVLDLHVPEAPERLVNQLAAEWRSFLGYFVSFAFIGGAWLAHTGLTHLLRLTDGVFVGLNLLLLLFVSFLPYTTSLFTKHLTGSGERAAVVIFGLNLTFGALVSSVMVSYATRMDELRSDRDPALVRWLERNRWTTAALLALSTAIGALFPKLGVVFYLIFSLTVLGQPLWRLLRNSWTRRSRPSDGDRGLR